MVQMAGVHILHVGNPGPISNTTCCTRHSGCITLLQNRKASESFWDVSWRNSTGVKAHTNPSSITGNACEIQNTTKSGP